MRTKLLLLLCIFTVQTNAQCWDKISSGAYHTIAIAHDGTLWSWGYNNDGELGDGTTINRINPTKIGTATDWVSVGAGYYHSFAIKSNGTLWAWGYNNLRQLGNNSTNNSLTPIQIGTDTNWLKVSGGEGFSVGLKTDGTLWTWGSDDQGQMGGGLGTQYPIPTQLGTATDWSDADAGRYHVIALKNNKIYTWGANGNGQVGNGGFGTVQSTPHLVDTTGTANFIKVEAGVNSSLAIKDDNTLWICGLVGPTNTSIFQQFAIPSTWSDVSAGTNHVIGVKSDGTLWAWGINDYGQISQPGFNAVNTPYQVTGTNFSTQIGTNIFSSVVLKNDGSLYGFGQNHVGQLGDGSSIGKNSITAIPCPSILSAEMFDSKSSILIYPNPVKSTLNISSHDNLSIQKLEVYDITGKQVKSQVENISSIDVADLKPGFYILELTSDERKEVVKFIKE